MATRCEKAKPSKEKIAANALKERQYYLHDEIEEKVEEIKEALGKVRVFVKKGLVAIK